MGTVYQWIQNLSVWLVLSAVILHLVPGKDYGKYVRFFSGMVLLLLFLEPMLKLTGTDGMITKLYEGNLAKEDQAEKELLQKLYESADLTEILPEEYQTSEEGADEKSQKKVSETQAVEVEEKTAASISDRTAVAGDRAAISEKIRFGRCGDRNRDNHRKPWII